MLAPSAYLHTAYTSSTDSAIACGPDMSCMRLEHTTYTKRADWLPGPERLPHEAAQSPLRFLLLRH